MSDGFTTGVISASCSLWQQDRCFLQHHEFPPSWDWKKEKKQCEVAVYIKVIFLCWPHPFHSGWLENLGKKIFEWHFCVEWWKILDSLSFDRKFLTQQNYNLGKFLKENFWLRCWKIFEGKLLTKKLENFW